MNRKGFLVVAAVAGLLLPPTVAVGQEQEEGHVFVFSTWKVRFDELEAYLLLFEKEYKPIVQENQYIKSLRVFTHLYGPDWNVLVIREYENTEAIAKSEKRENEIFLKKFPEKNKRDEYVRKVSSYILGHTDAIVREVPNLRK